MSTDRRASERALATDVVHRLVKSGGTLEAPQSIAFRDLVPWHRAAERATHNLHSYPAKTLRHIPGLFAHADGLSSPGDVVFDPFCGSGTVLLEAIIAGRDAVGLDRNPLATLISKAKSRPINVVQASQRLNTTLALAQAPTTYSPDVMNLDYWFSAVAQEELARIAGSIMEIPYRPHQDFFRVALSAAARIASYADPRLSVPVRLKENPYAAGHPLADRTRRRIEYARNPKPLADFARIAYANLERMSDLRRRGHLGSARVFTGDSRKEVRSMIPDSSVALTITSPPYLGAQKYVRSSQLGIGWLRLAPAATLKGLEAETVGREHFQKAVYSSPARTTGLPAADRQIARIWKQNPVRAHIAAEYLIDMTAVFDGVAKVTRPGGTLVMVAGNGSIVGEPFLTTQHLTEICRESGFRVGAVLRDTIRGRGLMTRRNRAASIITDELVVVLTKV